MSRLSYKTLLLILVFLLIPIVFLLRLNQRANPAAAGWFDEGWNYRVAINIGNTSGTTLTDFQVSISIGTSALITAGKMQSDCDDIRVTDVNGKILPYWFSGCNTDTTQVWPKIPNIPISGVTVYVYYGNPSATSGKSTIGTSAYPGLSCKSILDAGNSTGIGNYWIDPTNGNTSDKFQAYCDMTNDSGGWMLVTQSMINNEVGVSVTTTKTTNSNSGVNIANITTASGCGPQSSYKILFNDTIPWTKIKSDYIFTGGNSCWGVLGASYYGNSSANIIPFSLGTDTIRNQVKMGGSNGDNYDGINTRCDNLTINFWHGNQGYGTRSAQVILRRNSMSSLAGLGTDAGCVTNGYGWQYQNIYVREDTMTYAATAGTPATEEVGRGPIAYWSFDEGIGTTVYDSSSNKNNGSLGTGNSTPTWQTEDMCVSGKCLQFNGTSNVITHTTKTFTASEPWTFTMWQKTSTTSWNGFIGSLLGNDGYWMWHSGQLTAYLQSPSPIYFTNTVLGNQVPINTWFQLAVVSEPVNSTTVNFKVYINGKLTETKSNVTLPTSEFTFQYIGGASNRWFAGLLDEVKIYPYARTAAEIKQDYNLGAAALVGHKQEIAQVTPVSSKLLAHYKFDEGYSTNAHDSTSNVYTGTIATPIWSNDGVYNKALGFDGTNTNLVLPDALGTIANFGGTDGVVTFSMWLYVETDNTGVTIMHNLGGAWAYFGLNTSGVFQGMVYNCTTPANYWPTSATPIPLNTWTHVVSEFSGDGYKFYINGKLDKSVSDSNVCFNKPGTPHFGLDNIGWANFKGKIDDLKIYNSALTADEIKLDYNQGSAMQLGSLSSGTGNTAPSNAASQEYCVPGDGSTCSPPIAEWKFEEGVGATAYDTSGNSNHGIFGPGNSAPTWSTGKIGKALSFDGSNDYVNAGQNTSMDSLTSMTISAWINIGNTSSSYRSGIVSRRSGSGLNFDISGILEGTSGSIEVVEGGATLIQGSTTLSMNTWHHIVAVMDGTNIKLYLDGNLDGNGTMAWTWPSGVDVHFGNIANTYFFNGRLDQVRVYNYARSPAQIAWDYNLGAPVAQYKFDECQGTVAHDSIGTNNGTINIGASGSQTSAGTCQTANTAWGVGATGRNNASLNFDGTDDYINVIDNTILRMGTSDWTISAWVNSLQNTGSYQIIDKRSSGPTVRYDMAIINGKLFTELRSTSSPNVSASVTGNTGIADGQWHHVIATFTRSSNLNIYVDGKNDGVVSIASMNGVDINGSSEFKIGAVALNNSVPFSGKIDDVQIFNYALTAAQAKTVYNDGAVNFR